MLDCIGAFMAKLNSVSNDKTYYEYWITLILLFGADLDLILRPVALVLQCIDFTHR